MTSTNVRKTRRSKASIGWRNGLAGPLVLASMALFTPSLAAQAGQITGTVTNAGSGASLSEVQVYIEGQQLGTLTRADGRFLILNVPVGTYQLRAERIGFAAGTQSVTVSAGSAATANFELVTQALGLDEIVVTGTAGAARRREVGNTIAQINVAEVAGNPISTSDLLQGAATGLDIVGGGAEAGQGKQIRLRGNSSVSMTNNPIIYIDGIRMRSDPLPIVNSLDTGSGRGARVNVSPLDNLNPNDIERIEVIKGSAATTLYGTEASAGVIQIFTKRGSSGAPVWTAEIQQGTGWMSQFGADGMNYLNMEHYMRDPWWGGGYEGGDASVACITDDTADNALATGDQTVKNALWEGANSSPEGACSWPGAVWLQNYNLSVRGGGQALQYFISGQYQDDSYILPNDELEKYAFRGNFSMTPVENLQIQWNTGYSHQWQQNTSTANNAQGVTLNAFRQEVNYYADGDPRLIAETLEYDIQQSVERLSTGMTLTYTPLSNMTNRFTVGYDFTQQEGRNLRNFNFRQFPQGSITNDTFQNRLLTFDYVGTYSFDLTETLRSNFSWGGQAVGDEDRRVQAYGEDFPGAGFPTVSSGAFTFAQEEREKVWNAGFFFQNVFDIADRYFLTGGVRVDGNSAFGTGFGLQVYPKVSAAWIISDEAFWSNGLGTIKLRAAYGQSGRAPGAFDAVRTWDPVGFAGQPAFTPDNLGNPDLGPEVTAETEFGFDGSWLEDRLNATFTYYRQKTTDALMNVASIPSLGFQSNQLTNVGEISNRGIELQLNGAVVQGADWGLDLGLGVTTNKSKVESLCRDPDDETTCIAEFNDLNGRIIEGQPVPVEFGRKVANPDGVDGDYSYVLTDAGVEGDIPLGPQLPTHFVNPSLTLRVPGNIIVSARGEYRGGHVGFVNPITIGRSARSPLCFPYYAGPYGLATGTTAALELKPDTPNLWRERCDPSGGEDYFFDADYFKLRSLSASIPVDFAFPDRVSNATLTLALNNAWDWFREVPFYDVEIFSNDGAGDDGVGNSTERIPAPATFRMSLRVTF
jgi:TonB-linked SusC/RagA family outer membrane protein